MLVSLDQLLLFRGDRMRISYLEALDLEVVAHLNHLEGSIEIEIKLGNIFLIVIIRAIKVRCF